MGIVFTRMNIVFIYHNFCSIFDHSTFLNELGITFVNFGFFLHGVQMNVNVKLWQKKTFLFWKNLENRFTLNFQAAFLLDYLNDLYTRPTQ